MLALVGTFDGDGQEAGYDQHLHGEVVQGAYKQGDKSRRLHDLLAVSAEKPLSSADIFLCGRNTVAQVRFEPSNYLENTFEEKVRGLSGQLVQEFQLITEDPTLRLVDDLD